MRRALYRDGGYQVEDDGAGGLINITNTHVIVRFQALSEWPTVAKPHPTGK